MSAASATAPNPPAQRRSISRRVNGGGMNRPQCCIVPTHGSEATTKARRALRQTRREEQQEQTHSALRVFLRAFASSWRIKGFKRDTQFGYTNSFRFRITRHSWTSGAASATAPNPRAQRRSISRRVSEGGMNRPQRCIVPTHGSEATTKARRALRQTRREEQ